MSHPRILIAVVCLAAVFESASTPAATKTLPSGLLEVDRTADACTDFYQFACGVWRKENPLPSNRQTWNQIIDLQEQNLAMVRDILSSAPADGELRKATAFYQSCMDTSAVETAGTSALGPVFKAIDSLQSAEGLGPLLGQMNRAGVYSPLFVFQVRSDLQSPVTVADVDQSGLGLPSRDLYLGTEDRSTRLRTAYEDHVRAIFQLLGAPPDSAKADAARVVAFETAMAGAFLDSVSRRDLSRLENPHTIDQLQARMPHFKWREYLRTIQISAPTVNVEVPAYFDKLESLFATTPIADIRAYLRWYTVHTYADWLPAAFADAHFAFFNKTLLGQQQPQERWRRCVAATDNTFDDVVGRAFIERALSSGTTIADVLAMLQAVKQAMRADIRAVTWMDAATRREAERKLDGLMDAIGKRERARTLEGLNMVPANLVGNLLQARWLGYARSYAQIGKAKDRDRWFTTMSTANSYYDAAINAIKFPAGALRSPYYDGRRDAALNYGALGAMLGHELTHAFDDQGREYDAEGRKHDWWTAGDRSAFQERAQCFVDQFSGYTVDGDIKVNGKLTLGENIADTGGLRLALVAYLAGAGKSSGVVDGFTPEQRVFLGWAQLWCENATPEAERLKASTNPHAANRYRVNGAVGNLPEFQKAFACKADAPMVRPAPCRMW